MASLLNMLNNFLGSAGKPSAINLNSTNIDQPVEFKYIVGNLLSRGEGEQPTVTTLLLDPASGADLPPGDTAGGNGLPPLLATTATNIEASLQQLDAKLTKLTTLGSSEDIELAGDLAADQHAGRGQPANGELLASQATGAVSAGTNVINQALPVTAEIDTTTAAATLPTPQRSAADLAIDGSLNSAVGGADTASETASAVGPVARTAGADTVTRRGVAPDSVQQAADQPATSASTDSKPASVAVVEPAPVLSSNALEVPLQAVQASAVPPLDLKPSSIASDAVVAGSASVPTPTVRGSTQPAASAADLEAAPPVALTAKNPQQLQVEQALGNSGAGESDASVEVTRQPAVPVGPPLRPLPAAPAPAQTADANFANVAAQLGQGQSMNSLNERLQFMLLNGQNSAEIQLDPPELGSLQVRVTTRHEQTSVIFVAPNNAVRDALEQQLPRLRDTLEGAGLQLNDASVFAQTDDKPGTQPQSYADVEAADELIADELADSDGSASRARVSMQLVDAYI